MSRIEIIAPLDRAWVRMEDSLFSSFSLLHWLKLSLVAWLAFLWKEWLLVSPWGVIVNNAFEYGGSSALKELACLLGGPFFLGGTLVFILVFFALFTAWLKSRADFVLVENMARNQASIIGPWHEFRALGNSAFLWRIAYGLLCLILQSVFLLAGFLLFMEWAREMILAKSFLWPGAVTIIILILFLLAVSLAGILLSALAILFKDITIPLMYRRNLYSFDALRMTFSLIAKEPFAFVKYLMMVFILNLGLGILLTLLAFFLCCFGLIYLLAMALPFVWAAITLPLLLWLRLFSMEFLAQFGEDFNCFSSSGGAFTGKTEIIEDK